MTRPERLTAVCIILGRAITNRKRVEVRRIGEADVPGPPKRQRQRDTPTMDRAMEGLLGHAENRRQQQQQQRQRRSETPPKRARQTTRELRRETSATGAEYGREMETLSSWWTQRDQNQEHGDDEDMVVQATQRTGERAGAVCGAASSSTVAAPATSSRRKRSYDTQTTEVERSPTPIATQSKCKAQPGPKRSRRRSQPSPVPSTQTEAQPPPPSPSLGERQRTLSPLRRTRRRRRHVPEPEGGIPTPPAPQSPAQTLCDSLPFEECEPVAENETPAPRPSQLPTQVDPPVQLLQRSAQRPTQRSTPRITPRSSPRPSPAPKQRVLGGARPLPKYGQGARATVGAQPPAKPSNFRRLTAIQPAQCRSCGSTITPRTVSYRCETCNDVVCSRDCKRAIEARGCSCRVSQQPQVIFIDAAVPPEPTPAIPPTFSPFCRPRQ